MLGDSDTDSCSSPAEGILCSQPLCPSLVSTRIIIGRKHRPHPISATVTGPACRMVSRIGGSRDRGDVTYVGLCGSYHLRKFNT